MKKVLRKSRLVAGILVLVVVCLGIVFAGDVVVREGDLAVDGDLATTGTVTWSGGSSSNANTAYTHSQDNSRAHSDYLINNGDDYMHGSLIVNGTLNNIS